MKKRPKIKIQPRQPKVNIRDPESGKSADPAKRFSSLLTFVKKNKLVVAVIFLIALAGMVFLSWGGNDPSAPLVENVDPAEPPSTETAPKEEEDSVEEYLSLSGLLGRLKKMNGYKQSMTVLNADTTLVEMLQGEFLPSRTINELNYLAKAENITTLQAKKSWYTIESSDDDGARQKLFIYEWSPSQFYLIQALPTPDIKLFTKAEEVKVKQMAAVIKNDLWDAVLTNGGDPRIIEKMEDALKYLVDFYHVEPNDRFKLMYEEKWVDNKVVDVGRLLAISFETNDTTYHAVYYKDENGAGYLDQYGQSLKRKFLKSPVKYNRITSPYDPERIHPVLGEERPHLGTDYYAKEGDPIFATADGVITNAERGENNGNYIKIRHDKVYETQYLHLMNNGFAPGIKKGSRVKQGQVIGYAGSTGLATGPHVCYRFWKNGAQIDPLIEAAVVAGSFSPADENAFLDLRDSLLFGLEEVPYFEF